MEENLESRIQSYIYGQLIFNKGAKMIQWEGIGFATNGFGTTGYLHGKKVGTLLHITSYTKINSKQMTNKNLRPKTTKKYKTLRSKQL